MSILVYSAVFAALAVLNFTLPGPALAQQEAFTEFHGEAGPYQIDVIILNPSLASGQTQYSVNVRDVQTGEPVGDANVLVLAVHQEDGTEIRSNAVNTPEFPQRYRARLDLDEYGEWSVRVNVESPLGKIEVGIAELNIPAPRRFSSGSVVFIGVFSVVIAGAVYIWWSAGRARRMKEATQALEQPERGDGS